MKAQTLREILMRLNYKVGGTKNPHIPVKEAEAAIKAWAKELVGENEEIENPDNFTDHDFYAEAQNELRAELRTKIDAS